MGLRDHYESLTADERFVLFLRAIARGDRHEVQAVINSSRFIELKIIDFFAAGHATHNAELLHLVLQIDMALSAFMLWTQADDDSTRLLAMLSATQYVNADEAWRGIMAEKGIDPEARCRRRAGRATNCRGRCPGSTSSGKD